MVSPYRPLPPLGTLRAFEAVSRHLSFTMAATDLALTQSAISHQIRALEDHLGVRLFQRRHRGIEMTPEGRTFLEGARAGLDSILLASERIRNQHRVGVLTVATPAAFAIWWLVPRLGRFAALHPDIEVRIATIDGREPDLWRDGIDLAVVKRPAKIGIHDPSEMPLLREIVFPVCAPSLLNGGGSIRNPSDLARHPLIEWASPCRRRSMALVSRSVAPQWWMPNSPPAGSFAPSLSAWWQKRPICMRWRGAIRVLSKISGSLRFATSRWTRRVGASLPQGLAACRPPKGTPARERVGWQGEQRGAR